MTKRKIDFETGEVITMETPPESRALTTAPFWKTPFNHDTDWEAQSTALTCKDPSLTQQQFAKDSDINVILSKFMQTGELNTTGQAVYQDVEEGDLQDRIITRWEVDKAWSDLPAAVRNILKDPRTFTDYVQHCLDTGDLDPLRELGLATPVKSTAEPPEPKTPPMAPPVPPEVKEPPKAGS